MGGQSMWNFLSEGLFWLFLVILVISTSVKGFSTIYRDDLEIDWIVLVTGSLNIGIYILAFIFTGWLTVIILFIVSTIVGGSVAAETKQRLYKKNPDSNF